MEHFKIIFKPDGRQISIHEGATILEAAGQAGVVLNTVCGGQGSCKKCLVNIEPSGGDVLGGDVNYGGGGGVFGGDINHGAGGGIGGGDVNQVGGKSKSGAAVGGDEVGSGDKGQGESGGGSRAGQNENNRTAGVFGQGNFGGSGGDVNHGGVSGAGGVEGGGAFGGVVNQVGGKSRSGPAVAGEQVLACQYKIHSNLVVTIPDSSRYFEQKILSEGIETETRLEPDIYKKYVEPKSDAKVLGVAIDIGTTTVVAKLLDMKTGQTLATESATNPQTSFGDDVISRIAYAETDEKLRELQKSIVNCLNELIAKLCKQVNATKEEIFEAAVVGNTTMNHIFLSLPVTQLGQAPYKAYSVDAKDLPPGQIGLRINPKGNIHTVENIAGFVGADTVAMALAVGMDSVEQVTLAIDIGTNGELVLAVGDKLYSASCAAGPAFEGARIACGSRAVAGAIQAVVLNEDDIDLDVIGDIEPRSICGSGLLDAVAIMLDLGIIETSGRFAEFEKLKADLPPAIFDRLVESDGQPSFVLTRNGDGRTVFLNQRDIREVQLAKAAIRAGIKLLQAKVGIADSDIEQIFLAGAFGNFIRRESALRIGLLPAVSAEKIKFVGNAACSGAQMVLLSSHWRNLAKELAGRIEYIEIAHQAEFQEMFAESMMF